jgi:predicted helicase
MSEVGEILYQTTGWNNFQSTIKDASTQTKGDAFEQLVKKYLLFDPIYRTKIKKVWLLEEVPQSISVALNLPSTDQGIDLIAETHNGEYWAIQCKYKSDPTQSLTWREVSTFTGLTFGVCKGISFGLICTTGERYTKVLQDQENIGFCTNEVWSSLAHDFFKTLNEDFYKPKIAPYIPRPHQERAINNAKVYFKKISNQRGKFIMPCGTGKSLTAFWIAKELDARTILVSVPSISLLRQTLGVWLREYYAEGARSDLEWLCVCSDESVSTVKDDDAITFTQDLGIPCTTNSKQIVNWLNKTREAGTRIIFSTYQSGKVISLASRQTDTTYDVGILDEAHKTVGRKDSLFSHLLFDDGY